VHDLPGRSFGAGLNAEIKDGQRRTTNEIRVVSFDPTNRRLGALNFGTGPGRALCTLSTDEQGIIFSQLCNALEPLVRVYFSSVSCALRSSTQDQRQQLKVQHAEAAALCHKLGMRSCKELREAKQVVRRQTTTGCFRKGLAAADLATLGTLGSVLPALEELRLFESSVGCMPISVLGAIMAPEKG